MIGALHGGAILPPCVMTESSGSARRAVGGSSAGTCGTHAGTTRSSRSSHRRGSGARELFEGFERLIATCGEYEVAPAKTRVAFMGRVRFAGVNAISDRGMTISFALPKPMHHVRIRKVEQVAPGWYGHWMRITSPEQLDDELLAWLRESYHQMGMQERLASS